MEQGQSITPVESAAERVARLNNETAPSQHFTPEMFAPQVPQQKPTQMPGPRNVPYEQLGADDKKLVDALFAETKKAQELAAYTHEYSTFNQTWNPPIAQALPPAPPPPPNTVSRMLAHFNNDRIKFTTRKGTVIEMGEPGDVFSLIIGPMFSGVEINKHNALEIDQRVKNATMMQYVRSVDGIEWPSALYRYEEVVAYMRRLGDINCKACASVYEQNWGERGALWEVVKSDNEFGRIS